MNYKLMTNQIAVIVPLYRASRFLPGLLHQLENQTFERDRFEVILVDDNSPDDTREVATRLIDQSPLQIRLVERTENGGVSAARNTGWRTTDAPLLVFVDQDCEPDTSWLAQHYAAHEKLGATYAIAGYIQWSSEFVDDPASEHYKKGYFPDWANYRLGGSYFDFWITSNASVGRAGLEKVGGFDERFRHNYDDIVCGYRLEQAGYKVVLWRDALVQHARHLSTEEMLRRSRIAGREMIRFLHHYPALISHFFTLNPAEAFDWGWRLPSLEGLLDRTLGQMPAAELSAHEPFLRDVVYFVEKYPLPHRADDLFDDALDAANRYASALDKTRYLEVQYQQHVAEREAHASQKGLSRLWKRPKTNGHAHAAVTSLPPVCVDCSDLLRLLKQYAEGRKGYVLRQKEYPTLELKATPPAPADLTMLYDTFKEYALSVGILEGLREFYGIRSYEQLENHPLFGQWHAEWEERRAAQLHRQTQQAAAGLPELESYARKVQDTLAHG
jgi:GT2 family glycosyltransferase